MNKADLTAILLGGFVAGTIDVGAAALINMLSPIFVMKVIAGGLLGKAALGGGAGTACLGLVLQWAMSLIIAAIYVVGSHRFPVLRTRWIAYGLAYGVPVFLVMNYVVLPLSAWGKAPNFTVTTFAANLLAMLLFGLIIAFFARRAASATTGIGGMQ